MFVFDELHEQDKNISISSLCWQNKEIYLGKKKNNQLQPLED